MGLDNGAWYPELPDTPPLTDFSAGGPGEEDKIEGRSGDYSGGEPDWTPTSDVGIAYDTSTVPATVWNYYGGAWH